MWSNWYGMERTVSPDILIITLVFVETGFNITNNRLDVEKHLIFDGFNVSLLCLLTTFNYP